MNDITDIMIYESGSGGEMALKNEDLQVIHGLTNQVYLALFGGNIEESTSEEIKQSDFRQDYWGNEYLDDEFQFNSELEKTLMTVALNTNGLSIIKDAAERDLEFLKKYCDIEIQVSLIKLNFVEIFVILQEPSKESTKIKLVWDGTKNELIENKIL